MKILDKNIFTQERGLFRGKDGGVEWQDIKPEQGEKQVLTDKQILELSELILKIETHYGFPCDIEFVLEGSKFYIVQSRPITTLEDKPATVKETKIYTELVHVDLPLSLVELHYEQESAEKIPWANEKFTIKPYIFYERKNDSTYLYYDTEGVDWQIQQAGKYKDKKKAIKTIKSKYNKVKDVIESGKELNKKEFAKFIENIRSLWPWLNYMWWAIEYKDKNKEPLEDLINVRKYTEHFTPGIIAVFKQTIKNVYPEKNKYVDILLLSEVESGNLPSDSVLNQRLKSYAYTNNKLYKSVADILNEYEIKLETQSVDENNLSGQTAYPGIVKGKVRLISKREDISKFSQGEILVSSTTTPDYLPAMKKAEAIISEHGGAICHAAITSRELMIPCVVGVKNATKVLKDGDEVEVDANQGVVRVLNREDNTQGKDVLGLDLSEWEFEFQQRDGHPLIMADQWCKSLYSNLVKELNLDVKSYDYLFTGTYRGYVKAKLKQGLLDVFFRAVDNQNYLDYVFEKTMSRVGELVNFSQTVKAKLPTSNNEILKTWQEFNTLFLKVIPWFWIPYYLSEKDILTNKVKDGLKKYDKAVSRITDFNNALALLCFPTKNNKLQEEQESLYNLAKFAKDNKDYQASLEFNKQVDDYLDKFAWIKTFVMLPKEPLTKDELLKNISASLNSEFIEEYELQKTQKQKNKEIVAKVNSIIKNDKELIKAVSNAQHLGWMLSASVEDSLMALANLIPFYKQIAKAIGVDYQDWVHFTIDEVGILLRGEKLDYSLADRRMSYVYIIENGNRRIYFGEIAQKYTEYIDETINKVDAGISEIKGNPTSPGIVEGKVRLALSPDESREVQEGEILVTGMTSPDYVPAMKRAGAIVTDEGGLLSHAAIISRELGKPCVVGTKIATQVLKDGDEVEVDANSGIIKILKSKNTQKPVVYTSSNKILSKEDLGSLLPNLFLWVARPSSVQIAAFLCVNYYYNPYHAIDPILFLETDGDYAEWYLDKPSFDLHIKEKAKEFYKENFLETYITRDRSAQKELIRVCKQVGEIPKLIGKLSKEEIVNRIQELYEYPSRPDSYIYFSLSVWAFEEIVLPKYKEKLKIEFGDKFNEIFNIISQQTETSAEQDYRIRLSNLARQNFEKGKLEEKLHDIQKNFLFLKIYNPEAEGLTIDDVREDYKNIELEEGENLTQQIEKNKKDFETFLKTVMNREVKTMIRQINYSVNFKTLRADRITHAFSFLAPFYKYLMEKLQFSRTEVGNLLPSEIIDFFKNDIIPKPRRDFGGVLYWRGQFYILDKKLQKAASSVLHKVTNTREFNGQIGNKGYAQGMAKVIKKVSDLKEVKGGDILVAQFTRPEYTSAIKKAAAIVTNDGGITSHAAIISRELGKPCIIGTKIATQVLKDGDEVEVDANEGVVRVLKRADDKSSDN